MNKQIIEFKKRLKAKRASGLALDIDNILSATTTFWVNQLQVTFGNPTNLTVEEIIIKYQYVNNVPQWQNEKAYKLMRKLRDDNQIQEELPLIKNSNLIVQKINKIIPIVTYLTARPSIILSGTKNWLKKYNFPEEEIIMRPKNIPQKQIDQWKAEILEYLYPEVKGIVDDNRFLINNLSENYQGTVYLYGAYEEFKSKIKVVFGRSWDDILNKIIVE